MPQIPIGMGRCNDCGCGGKAEEVSNCNQPLLDVAAWIGSGQQGPNTGSGASIPRGMGKDEIP